MPPATDGLAEPPASRPTDRPDDRAEDRPEDRIDRLRALKKGLDIRLAITIVLALMAVIVMVKTRHGLAYFLSSSTPTPLGDVRERFARGDASLGGEHDSYVEVSGLVPTRLIAVAPDEGASADQALEFVFFCPLYNITVLSQQRIEVPAGGWSEFDPRLKDLVLEGIAEPGETMVSWAGKGRLLRGNSAPAELKPFVAAYARRLSKKADELWVIVEGQAPSYYLPTLVLWLVALVPTAVSIVFLMRARRAWERAVATGPAT